MTIEVTDIDGVVCLTLNRPPVNALDAHTLAGLQDFLHAHDRQTPLVITGAGRAFCAGGDTKQFFTVDQDQRLAMVAAINAVIGGLCAIEAPVVAAVNGHATGTGFMLMVCADWRIGVSGAAHQFALAEARAGVNIPELGLPLLRHEVPAPLLRQLTLSGRASDLTELLRWGVIDEVVSLADLQSQAINRARELASQDGFKAVKRQIRGPKILG